jgi:hypothetical protein
MKWSVKRNGDFAKFRPQVLSMMNFIKGIKDCKDTFSAEETPIIRELLEAVHINGVIDNVKGDPNNHTVNSAYKVGKECDEKGVPTFKQGGSGFVANPNAPYLEQVYMAPRTQPALRLGVASDITYEEVNMTEIKDIEVSKRHVSTSSNSSITGITDKGSATVGGALDAGNKAASNTSGVYVSQDQAPKSLTKAEQKAAKKKAKEEAKKKAREEALMKDPNTNPYLQHWVQTK